MRYDITLTMTYSYDSPAAGVRQLAHLLPLDLLDFDGAGGSGQPVPRQRLIAGRLDFDPEPAVREDRFDFFGNAISEVAFHEALDEIVIRLQARVEVNKVSAPIPATIPLDGLVAAVAACWDLGPRSPVHFIYPSPRVPFDPAIADYARGCSQPGASVAGVVEALGRRLNVDMKFDAEATTASTPISESFAQRHGVCQDFSQIMISALRSLGIPAGYVSGFLRTLPPPGKPRLEGADAMHAWVCAWCGPDTGWVEYDPTNATFAGTDHVVVAYGRDYADVAPVRGAMRIAGSHTSDQAVDVIPLTD
ncbi:transglutaminase-like putative cysteine protease [Hoeflea marina]|uniref:Transglutaminase-like putative cysteine protease n=1 Tax=Hoeflea marina TaxID=274592 RepID=A0A317PLP0_9HYPH|nr:transglutaminase family protein [Hoeflea marina]PWW01666.1 transglutaminase-like putative cysteine protease [Hoeflea marina]